MIAALAFFIFAADGQTQSPLEPPLKGRPTNFSHLVGRFTIAAQVSPAEALVEDPITLRVTIAGDVAAGEPPSRKNLRLFADDFDEAFFLEPIPDDDQHSPETKSWEFVWRLRPKSAAVRELPSLALAYYSPQVRRYQTARSQPISLTIKPRPKVRAEPVVPRNVPESFLQLAPWSADFSRGGARLPRVGPIAGCVVLIVLAFGSWIYGGVLAKRTAGARELSRTQFGEAALAALRNRPTDPAPFVKSYLQSRFGLTACEPSPAEIDRILKTNGVAPALRVRWRAWSRAEAAARFAPRLGETKPSGDLIDEAIALIATTEGVK